jgi:hypothetical protein
LQELIRTSKHRVLIRCPHRWGKFANLPYHKCRLSCTWFSKSLQGIPHKIYISKLRSGFPFNYLRVPEEITVKIIKE